MVEGSSPYAITVGPDGNIWFTDYLINDVGVLDLTTHKITEYLLPNDFGPPLPPNYGYPEAITVGPDGNLWVSTSGLFTVNPTTREIRFLRESILNGPAGGRPYPVPYYGAAVGPDGDFWASSQSGTIRVDPQTGHATEYPQIGLLSIVFDLQGKLWYIEGNEGTGGTHLGVFDPKTGDRRLFDVHGPRRLAMATDDAIWFTHTGSGTIGRIDTLTHVVTEYPTPWDSNTDYDDWISASPDGRIWFTSTAAYGVIRRPRPDLGRRPSSLRSLYRTRTHSRSRPDRGNRLSSLRSLNDPRPRQQRPPARCLRE